ncbi:MAG: helix-hairpin-helix domain-containing protein [Candidatus Sericytochromatia bacterium]
MISKLLKGFAFSLLLTLTTNATFAQDMNVNFIDIGQGDSELIQLPDGKNILIDAGDKDATDKLVKFLKNKSINKLDLVVISHPHLDHYGGLLGLLNYVDVDKVLDSGAPTSSTTYLSLLKKFASKKTKFSIVRKGEELKFTDNITLSVVAPEDPLLKDTKSDTNNASIVAKLTHNKVSFLFTGDIESESQERILNGNKDFIKSDILKVAHHGSRYTSSNEFLDRVNPKIAVISCGVNNDYGHPHKETLKRLENKNIKVYRTDLQGDITIVSNGETYQISSKKSERIVRSKKSKIDLNTATNEELDFLPAMNPERVKQLISLRPIKTWSDLKPLKWDRSEFEEIRKMAFISKNFKKDNSESNNNKENVSNKSLNKININTATKEELIALPGIGEKTAEKIIKGRPYKTIDDLKRIPGMKNRLKKFSDLIFVN